MLIEATGPYFAALIAGKSPGDLKVAEGGIDAPEVLEMLRGLSARVGERFTPNAWMMVEDGEVVGLCSIIRLPEEPGAVMIGYGVAASRRERGIARRAIAELLDWAKGDPRISAVTAETSTQNLASQRVLERNGFEQVGRRHDDEDGPLICWRLVL